MYWLDYSAAKLSGAVIKQAGYGGVIRYIDAPDLLRTKHTNKAEYDDHIRNGLEVRLVMQNTTTDADGGFAAGVANAKRAKAGADMLGYTGVIFFTNDRTTVPNPAAWTGYLDGAASVLGIKRTGAYGFNNALTYAKGHASAFWQSGRRSELVGHANFWQDNNTQVTVGGITCDRNLVIADYTPPSNGGSHVVDKELFMLVPPGTDDYISIPANGNTSLFIASAYGREVKLKEIWAVGDSPADGAQTKYIGALTVAPDRPGAISVAAGFTVRSVTLRYVADHSFTAWTA